MVTSVSTDRGRRQRLQSKSHIQAPAQCHHAKYQSWEPWPPRIRLQSKEKKEREEKLSSHLFLQMFGLRVAQRWANVDLINDPFPPSLLSHKDRVKNSV